ncbi:hypothetical protein ED176_14820 [Enterococcus faecium]|nr:hypothetical protein EA467_08100 [Enterococcus faecium]RAX32100.1 hypothetical protein DQE80_01305 [Enterococcus sp. HPCN18]HAW88955.1 hypothetical protein [Enterococcus sp.]EGP5091503.1 hypothetical protein [Enterococcus faecium]EGP5093838.1 hypothetical protein [Enterococcus faecium]
MMEYCLFEKKVVTCFLSQSLQCSSRKKNDPNDRFLPVFRIVFLFQLYRSFSEEDSLLNR